MPPVTRAAEIPSSGPSAAPQTIVRERRRRRPSGEPPPLPRPLRRSGKYWVALTLAVLGSWAVVATIPGAGATADIVDHRILLWIAAARTGVTVSLARRIVVLATPLTLQVLWLASLVVMLIWRRWRHLVTWIVAMWLISNLTALAAIVIQRPRPMGIEILGPWDGFAMPSQPMAVLAVTAVNILYALVPAGRPRDIGKWIVAATVTAVAFSRLLLAQDAPSDVLAGVICGVTVPLACFRLLVPNDVFPVKYRRGRTAHLDVAGPRGEAIQRALKDQLGILPLEVVPFGLEGSGGSTPLRIKVEGNPDTYLFGKLYAYNHLRSDRFYKLTRTLLYGRLEDESAFRSVRQLVQYEDYLLRLLLSARLPVPEPYGFVEITPSREYLLVTEFATGATELGKVEVDDDIIDQGLAIVRQLWDAGVAHRDIKPANLLVRDHRLMLVDCAFAEVRPSPWRQAVDLANMMLVLALRSDVQRVYSRARRVFTDDEIAEAFAATRGLTMPTQLRRMIRAQGRDLHEAFCKLPARRLPPIKIQRWSWRRVVLSITVLLGLLLAALIAVPLLQGSPL